MKEFEVTMYNDLGCDIASENVIAHDENEAIEIFIKEYNIVLYPNDTFQVKEYCA